MAAVCTVADTGVELLVIVRVALATVPSDGVTGRHVENVSKISGGRWEVRYVC